MRVSPRSVALLVVALWALGPFAPLAAESRVQTNGTDTFVAASSGMPDLQTPGDLFASGGAVVTRGSVAGDAHVAGFDLDLEAEVTGDLYAAGAAITLHAPVGGDVSMMGMTVRTAEGARTAGNARLLGGTITVDGSVGGALAVTGGEITLNAAVGGDAWVQGGSIGFGPGARIAGTLTYSAPEPVTIPAEVIPAARVVYHKTPPLMDRFEHMRDPAHDWPGRDWPGRDWPGRDMPAMPGTLALVTAFLVTLGFLILLGGTLLALAPQRVETLRRTATQQPGLTVLIGVLGIATLLGLVPVAVMTVIGLPFVPILALAILAVWTLGYVFGAYAVAIRLHHGLGGREDPGLGLRIALLGCGALLFSLLNFVPVLGWMVNFLLVLFGIGALSTGVLRALAARLPQDPRPAEHPPAIPEG